MYWKHIATVSMLLLLTACASSPPTTDEDIGDAQTEPLSPLPNASLFKPTAPVPPPEALIGLTAEQEEQFLAYFHGETVKKLPAHHRIRDFLNNRLEDFGYLDDTLTASRAMAEHRGNCMSLAALTLALSDAVGVETRFQMVNTAPVFERDERMIISSNHVRSHVYDPDYAPDPGTITLRRPHVVIDYFPGDKRISGEDVSREEFLALFYQNLAAEAMIEGDLDAAFPLVQAALAHHPDQADSLNLLAILHRRAGDPVTAEAYYSHAGRIHGDRVDILNNHANLLRHQGRMEEAAAVEARLAELDDPNPFHWLELGEQARQRGLLRQALQWYQEAAERAPYLHEPHWRMAIIFKELGHPRRSMAALARAEALSRKPDEQNNYQAKLYSLKREYGGGERR